jgi:hypothetical protein
MLQLDDHVASLQMNTRLVITSLAPPGVVIQLDGHGAERLAMTPRGSLPYRTARRFVRVLAMTMPKSFLLSAPHGVLIPASRNNRQRKILSEAHHGGVMDTD